MSKTRLTLVDGMTIAWAFRRIAEKYKCEKCGSKCRYDSIVTIESYRAFAVCTNPACGHKVEF